MQSKIEQIAGRVMALQPIYSENGDVCRMLTDDGREFIDLRGIKAVKAALARRYALDLSAQQGQLREMLGKKALLPFYVEQRVFIPFKMRRAIAANDKSYGYVEFSHIKDIKADGKQCRLILKSGGEMPLSCSATAAIPALYMGQKTALYLQAETDQAQVIRAVVTKIISRLCDLP